MSWEESSANWQDLYDHEHDRAEAAEALVARTRVSLTKVWNAHLELLLMQKLEDGTPVLKIVFDLNPTLRDRLRVALEES